MNPAVIVVTKQWLVECDECGVWLPKMFETKEEAVRWAKHHREVSHGGEGRIVTNRPTQGR